MIVNKLPMPREKSDIADASVIISFVRWTGSTIYLSDILRISYGGQRLVYGTDYTLSGTTSAINKGTYSATATGIGKYKGTKNISWTIYSAIPNNTICTIKVNDTVVADHVTYHNAIEIPITAGEVYNIRVEVTWDAGENIQTASIVDISGYDNRGEKWDMSTSISGKTVVASFKVKLYENGVYYPISVTCQSQHYYKAIDMHFI